MYIFDFNFSISAVFCLKTSRPTRCIIKSSDDRSVRRWGSIYERQRVVISWERYEKCKRNQPQAYREIRHHLKNDNQSGTISKTARMRAWLYFARATEVRRSQKKENFCCEWVARLLSFWLLQKIREILNQNTKTPCND